MNRNNADVLIFSREAGGAEALAPAIKELQKHFNATVLAKDYAWDRFKDHGLHPVKLSAGTEKEMESELSAKGLDEPAGLLTSATSLPKNDMTERYLWQWARKRNIPSLAVVDQWQNYAMRFSGSQKRQRLKYLPDKIAVMNVPAKKDCIAEGIPAEKIIITGQPAFDELIREKSKNKKPELDRVRKICGSKPGELLITFISECLKRDKNIDYGYDEELVLVKIIRQLSKIVELTGKSVRLVVKLHPQNIRDDFKDIKTINKEGLSVVYVQREVKPRPLVMASDYVVGMASVLIIESILLGKPTISYQDKTNRNDLCYATTIGAIPLLTSEKELFSVLKNIIIDKIFRKRYLADQAKLSIKGDAAKNLAECFRSLIDGNKGRNNYDKI